MLDTGHSCEATLGDVLSFYTGADMIPLLGFPISCTLSFNKDNVMPVASTCALELTLPTKYHNDFKQFKEKMLEGILWHGGFGKQRYVPWEAKD